MRFLLAVALILGTALPGRAACGSDPGDAARLLAAQAAIEGECSCCDFAHPRQRARCVARAAKAAVRAGILRRVCRSTAVHRVAPCAATTGPVCGACNGDADCATGEFCECQPGTCSQTGGTCIAKPAVCYDIFAPVCGCDGTTYPNDCDRRTAGACRLHAGACQQTCQSDKDCDDGNPCSVDSCQGGVCEHGCVCATPAGTTCCPGPSALCVRPCGATATGTCGGTCPSGATCETLTTATACGCVSGAGGPCGGNIFPPPPVCAPGLVCQQSNPDVGGVCVAATTTTTMPCIPFFGSGCSITTDCCQPCVSGTRAPCAVCLQGQCSGTP